VREGARVAGGEGAGRRPSVGSPRQRAIRLTWQVETAGGWQPGGSRPLTLPERLAKHPPLAAP